MAWADEQWAAEDHTGAVFDQDEMMAEFCGCIDCSDLLSEEVDETFCGFCKEDVYEGLASAVYVCAVDDEDDIDDELVTANYRGLRDVDGWQRHDP